MPFVTRRRDWFRILRDLAAARVSYAQVARKCNRDVSTIKGWADGGDPKDSDARIVLALYAKYCPLKFVEHQREFEVRLPVVDGPDDTGGAAGPSEPGASTPGGDVT